ncbi:MAG: hypothetical protein J6Y78_04590 [Paludibacteraceae bacterium]|nr:hypothetical protein [Paludibacteraceae bacterium]
MDKELVIKEKESLINDLKESNDELVKAMMNYRLIQSQLWLETDFEEKIGKKRPTVDEKKAYVNAHSIIHKEQYEIAKNNREIILFKIKLCEDKLAL